MNIEKIHEAIEKERLSKKSGIMQYPQELEGFIKFMVDHDVHSYLEIGVKRGHLVTFIRDLLDIEVYACDVNFPEHLKDRKDIDFYLGSSHSEEYFEWRHSLGMIDMVLIDADHKIKPARRDYKREKNCRHRFLALHDIANRRYRHLQELWESMAGMKVEFINKDINARLLCIEHKDDDYLSQHRAKYGRSCGIGVCWQND